MRDFKAHIKKVNARIILRDRKPTVVLELEIVANLDGVVESCSAVILSHFIKITSIASFGKKRTEDKIFDWYRNSNRLRHFLKEWQRSFWRAIFMYIRDSQISQSNRRDWNLTAQSFIDKTHFIKIWSSTFRDRITVTNCNYILRLSSRPKIYIVS